jgi:hypothetical protein
VVTWSTVLVGTTIVSNIAIILGSRRKSRDADFVFEAASKVEFEKFVEKTDKELAAIHEIIRTEFPKMLRDVNEAGEKRIRRVHARIDPLIIGVSALCAKQGVKMPPPQFLEEEE